MAYYKYIDDLAKDLKTIKENTVEGESFKEFIPLLKLLEEINPCDQSYEIVDNCIIISYKFKLNILNFKNIFPLRLNMEIIALPISLCHQGYFGHVTKVKTIVEKRKGLKLILNSDVPIKNGGLTLSTFIFDNRFKSFNEYINSLRSPYRRRLKKALSLGDKLYIRSLDRKDFNHEHYKLYLSIMKRTKNPLETLSMEFFINYEGDLYEFLDRQTNKILGFIQIKEINNRLLFLFGGFNKEDNKAYDLYYNMLITIVKIGIEKAVEEIDFGQTGEESKLKIGCREKKKYLYIHHRNLFINQIIQPLVAVFSYKAYGIKHNVFKEGYSKVEEL